MYFLTLQSRERERESLSFSFEWCICASVCSTACVCDNAHETCMDKTFSFVRGTVHTQTSYLNMLILQKRVIM